MSQLPTEVQDLFKTCWETDTYPDQYHRPDLDETYLQEHNLDDLTEEYLNGNKWATIDDLPVFF